MTEKETRPPRQVKILPPAKPPADPLEGSPVRGEERYARTDRGGHCYAVELVTGRRRRMHDPDPLPVVLERWANAPQLVLFRGATDAPPPGDAVDEDDEPATYAGGIRSDQIAGIAYWTPEDDGPGEDAERYAAALMGAVAEAQGGIRLGGE